MKKLLGFAACAFIAYTGVADAKERWPKWYVGLTGSVQFVEETDVSVASAPLGEVDFDAGWGAGASLGYMPGGTGTFIDMMRFELEYTYRESGLDSLAPAGGGAGTTVADDLSANVFMANALVDIPTGTMVTPYVGGGLGVADMELNIPTLGVNDNDTVFAYQVMLGLGYTPASIPRTTFSLGYRYFGTSDPEFAGTGGQVEHQFDSHIVEAGARFAF